VCVCVVQKLFDFLSIADLQLIFSLLCDSLNLVVYHLSSALGY